MEKNPGLVFFGLFLIGMLFVPPSIPFMVPEAEAQEADTTPPTIEFRIPGSLHPNNVAGNGNLSPNDTLIFDENVGGGYTPPDATGFLFDGWHLQLNDDVDGFPGHWRSGLLYNYPAPGETPYHSCSVDGFEIPKSNEDVGNGSADYGSWGYDSQYEGYSYYYKLPVGTSYATRK